MKKLITFISALIFAININANIAISSPNISETDSISLDSLNLIPAPVLVDSAYIFPEYYTIDPNIKFIPIIFEKQQIIQYSIDTPKCSANEQKKLFVDREWLDYAIRNNKFDRYHLNRTIYSSPDVVEYNFDMLPEPPKQYVIKSEPGKVTMSIEELIIDRPEDMKTEKNNVKLKNWIHAFDSSLQFSQAYISGNWYQGGNSNLNLLGSFNYSIKLNPNIHTNLLFENYLSYKISVNNAPEDSLRNYSISEDLFQFNTKFGVKATKKWYYSATAQFKTQIFKNFATNERNLKAAFLSPAELNVGVGMTYNTENKAKTLNFNMSLSPLSYNLKICSDIEGIDPTTLGIDAGKHTANEIGSNIEGRLSWNFNAYISWSSRIYAFTDYKYIQGDWENTINFSFNKFLSTQIYLHLRYDSSKESDKKWKNWQFKEILSLGFYYRI